MRGLIWQWLSVDVTLISGMVILVSGFLSSIRKIRVRSSSLISGLHKTQHNEATLLKCRQTWTLNTFAVGCRNACWESASCDMHDNVKYRPGSHQSKIKPVQGIHNLSTQVDQWDFSYKTQASVLKSSNLESKCSGTHQRPFSCDKSRKGRLEAALKTYRKRIKKRKRQHDQC